MAFVVFVFGPRASDLHWDVNALYGKNRLKNCEITTEWRHLLTNTSTKKKNQFGREASLQSGEEKREEESE